MDNGISERDFLLAERLALHKGVESVFGFHSAYEGLGVPYWEKDIWYADLSEFFDRYGRDLREISKPTYRGKPEERSKAMECIEYGLSMYGLTLDEVREKHGKKEKARRRKWIQTIAFFATECSIADIAEIVDRSYAQVLKEIHDTWYEDHLIGCIDWIAFDAFRGVLHGVPFEPMESVLLSWYQDEAES